MNKKQKKFLMVCFFILLVLASIASITLWIYGFVNKDDVLQFAGMITSLLSPTTLIGIIIKLVINKVHLKQIDKRLNKMEEVEKEIKKTNNRNRLF